MTVGAEENAMLDILQNSLPPPQRAELPLFHCRIQVMKVEHRRWICPTAVPAPAPKESDNPVPMFLASLTQVLCAVPPHSAGSSIHV